MLQHLAAVLFLGFQGAQASPIVHGTGPVALSLEQVQVAPNVKRGIIKRDWPADKLTDNSNLFLATIGIGTPPQSVSIAVDTGSPASWVDPDCNSAGLGYSQTCSSLGHYNPATSNPPGVPFPALSRNATYADGSGALLQGYKDVWTWANSTKVPNTPFAIATKSSGSYVGIMGLGPDVTDGFDTGFSNYSLPNTMQSQGIIPSRAFSMGFTPSYRARNVPQGSLIFGGVDKNSYSGSFFQIPILPKEQGLPYNGKLGVRYWVQVTQIINHRSDGKQGVAINLTDWDSKFLLDSGTTATYLSNKILPTLLADYPPSNLGLGPGNPLYPCNLNGSLEFVFGDKGSIRAPYGAFSEGLDTGNTLCSRLLLSAGNGTSDGVPFGVLGLGFLKAAYAVFDWDKKVINLAQGASCGGFDVAPIGASGADSVLGVKGNCK